VKRTHSRVIIPRSLKSYLKRFYCYIATHIKIQLFSIVRFSFETD